EWHGDVTRLFRGDRFLLTKDSPESRLDDSFYMLLLPVFFAGLVAPIGVEIRERGSSASTYDLPRVIRPRRLLLYTVGVLGLLALHGGERLPVRLLSFAARERAILADVLRRYSGAGRASASVDRVHGGDRGRPFGIRAFLSMSGWQRISPIAWWEWVLAPVCIALVGAFLGAGVLIDAPLAERLVFVAVGGPLLLLSVISGYTWRRQMRTEREL